MSPSSFYSFPWSTSPSSSSSTSINPTSPAQTFRQATSGIPWSARASSFCPTDGKVILKNSSSIAWSNTHAKSSKPRFSLSPPQSSVALHVTNSCSPIRTSSSQLGGLTQSTKFSLLHSKPTPEKMRKLLPNFPKPGALQRYIGVMDWENRQEVTVYPLAKRYTFWLACRLFLSVEDPTHIALRFVDPFQLLSAGSCRSLLTCRERRSTAQLRPQTSQPYASDMRRKWTVHDRTRYCRYNSSNYMCLFYFLV